MTDSRSTPASHARTTRDDLLEHFASIGLTSDYWRS